MAEPVFLPNMDHHRVADPKLWETLRAIQSNLKPTSQPSPPPVNSINVTAANGWFTVTLTDSGQVSSTIHYFIEYSTTPGFEQPIVIDHGASRTLVLYLGNQTLYWRAYSQYLTPFSVPGATITFGTPPTGVPGGGATVPPAVASTGSGTGSTTGQQGGGGFGKLPIRPAGTGVRALL